MHPRLVRGVAMCWLVTACGGDRARGDSSAPADSAGASRAAGAPARAPAGAGGELRDPVPMTVAVEVDGANATYTGQGECHHTADASIYEVPAHMWSAHAVSESGELRYLNLTLWQPKGAGQMQVSLALTVGERSHDIATVKGAEVKGSGTGRADPKGAGGSMRVDGKAADGATVRLTVECERWTEPVAEGG